jgi:hypothetical protein
MGSSLEIEARRCTEAADLPLALHPIALLIRLDEFDALSLRRTGEDGVYLQS